MYPYFNVSGARNTLQLLAMLFSIFQTMKSGYHSYQYPKSNLTGSIKITALTKEISILF